MEEEGTSAAGERRSAEGGSAAEAEEEEEKEAPAGGAPGDGAAAREDGGAGAAGAGIGSDEDLKTMYCLVELPKGEAPRLSFDQFSALETAAPSLHFGTKRSVGRVDSIRGAMFVFESKYGLEDDKDAPEREEAGELVYHSRATKIMRFC